MGCLGFESSLEGIDCKYSDTQLWALEEVEGDTLLYKLRHLEEDTCLSSSMEGDTLLSNCTFESTSTLWHVKPYVRHGKDVMLRQM